MSFKIFRHLMIATVYMIIRMRAQKTYIFGFTEVSRRFQRLEAMFLRRCDGWSDDEIRQANSMLDDVNAKLWEDGFDFSGKMMAAPFN